MASGDIQEHWVIIVIPVKRNGTFGDGGPSEQEGGVAEWVESYWKGHESEQDIVPSSSASMAGLF